MSASSEKKEAVPRVTRSMRRLNSESESIDLENRPETPTGRIRKKIEDNEEAISTPKRGTRATSSTRSLIEEPINISSPLRRTTRRMSSDRAVESPIRATRATRRSNQNLNDSADDSVVFVSELPATPRTQKAARKTLVKLEEVAEEETENNKLDTSENADELELRTRSISKSPIVTKSANGSPEKYKGGAAAMSLQDELNAANKENEDKNGNLEDDKNDSITEELEERPTTTIESIKTTSQPEESTSNIVTTKETIEESTVTITRVENVAEETPAEDVTSYNAAQSSLIEPMEVDDNEKDYLTVSHAGDLTDSSIRVEVRLTEKHEVIEYEVDNMMNDFVADNTSTTEVEIINNQPEINDANKSVNEEEKDDDEQPLPTDQKSPSKRGSNTWSTAVGGKSDRIDTFAAQSVDVPVQIEGSPKKHKKIISSDESESDAYEKNSLIDDEAQEVGSDEESMTKSERDFLEENEIVEDGESLGSQDSNVDELESEHEDDDSGSNDSFIVDEEIEEQYEMTEEEEELENEEIQRPKRKSRIIQESSDSEEESPEKSPASPDKSQSSLDKSQSSPDKSQSSLDKSQSSEKENSISPQKSPGKFVASNAIVGVEAFKTNRISTRQSLPHDSADVEQKKVKSSRNSIPSGWRVEKNAPEKSDSPLKEQVFNERKRKRESVIHGAESKRFKEMSPNESEAVHMEDIEDDDEQPSTSTKKVKKSKDPQPADITKLLDRCEEHLEKYTNEKKAKLALKRKKIEEKKAKKLERGESSAVDGSPGSENKENSEVKKKKKKQKAKKQLLVSEIEDEKDDMATKLTKRQEKLEEKREKKRKKKELQKAAKESGEDVPMETDESVVVAKKKKKTHQETANVSQKSHHDINVEHKKVLGENKQKQRVIEEPAVVIIEKKSKKRRIEDTLVSNDDDGDVIERPKAKKKLNILKQVDEESIPKKKSRDAPKDDFVVLPTVTSKLKTVIPKGLDKQHAKKLAKKKMHSKVIPEQSVVLPRPVWTSAGTFIEEPIKPFKFKSTEYKPINGAGGSQFRVISFEAKSKKAQPKSKMELLMRNTKGRDKTMRNMKNLM